jgi:hypothetical protein
MQKDGYKFMLSYMAKRRRLNPGFDIQSEEVKLFNAVKLCVESGWVVDQNYFRHLCQLSGIDIVFENYNSKKS